MTPLETAMAIESAPTPPTRDPKTGLYLVGATSMTLAQYESGLHILELRKKVATAQAPR